MQFAIPATDGTYVEGFIPGVCFFGLCPKSDACMTKAAEKGRKKCEQCTAIQPDKA